MQILKLSQHILTAAIMVIIPFIGSAQETKKEVHIKIVENGVVTKDTVYTHTGESPEIDHFVWMEEHQAQMKNMQMKHMQMKEQHVMFMNDSIDEDFEWVSDGEKHKEIKVIVHEGEGRRGNHEVEEIWVGEPGEGRPCRTIIIHDGDCPGNELGHITPPPPPRMGEKPSQVKRKVVKTDGGKKVMIIETIDDKPSKKKDK